MKKPLFILSLLMITSLSFGQTVLTIEGTTTNNTTTGDWSGVNISRSVAESFIFRNNSITSVNVSGYMLQAGDETVSTSNNNLQGEVISGNKLVWNGTDMTSITHGVFTGFNINAVLKYNYCYRVPMALVRKSNGMTNTSGGVGYNIVNMTNAVATVVKGMNGVNIYNNTFYSNEIFYTGPASGTWRGLVDIYTNTDITPNAPSTGTKIKNNIFYTKHQIYNIYVYDAACLPGFESDYNVFYCEEGTPVFNYLGTYKTFAQWQALGFDTHSVVLNPDFIDFTSFVPKVRLDYGTVLGSEWQSGLSVSAIWTVGAAPETADQNGTWQVGARVYAGQGGTPCTPPPAPAAGIITQPTCAVPTGSVVLSGLPSPDGWTLTQLPDGKTILGTGTSVTISGLEAGTYTFKVTNTAGCVSLASANIVINAVSGAPTVPVVSTVTQPTCSVSTGSVVLTGLPASGTWTLKRTPGSTSVTGTGTSYTMKSLTAGTYAFTVSNSSGCISATSANVVINAQPAVPSVPKAASVIQPSCTISTGSTVLSGLPSTGTWTLTRSPGGTMTGTGTTLTVSDLGAGTSYTFRVTNDAGCTSSSYLKITINTQPSSPKAPVIGRITQPTLTLAKGSVALSGLPSSGNWILTRSPDGTALSGRGSTKTVTALPAGNTYTFMVSNSSGCVSPASANVVINAQPKSMTSKSLSDIAPDTMETVQDESLPSMISVYPNPTDGPVTISYNDYTYSSVDIINSSGILVGKEKAVTPIQQLDLSAYKPGLYILEFSRTDKSMVKVKILRNR